MRQLSKSEVLTALSQYLRVRPHRSVQTRRLELTVRSMNLSRLP